VSRFRVVFEHAERTLQLVGDLEPKQNSSAFVGLPVAAFIFGIIVVVLAGTLHLPALYLPAALMFAAGVYGVIVVVVRARRERR
jgi:Flp pilus assembly protein TadB